MKKIVSVFIVVCIFVCCTNLVLGSASGISVFVNGETVNFDTEPIIQQGRTLVPVRAISECLKYDVKWDATKMQVSIQDENDVLLLTIGSNAYTKNGVSEKLDVPANIQDGRTMVPLRLIAEAFNCNVEWDDKTRTVYVEKTKESETSTGVDTDDNSVVDMPVDFTDYSQGSIKNPFMANEFENDYKTRTIKYQPTKSDGIMDIVLHATETLGGSEAQKFLKEYKEIDSKNISENQAWRVYEIKIRYVEGDVPLYLGELFNSNNIYTTTGAKYKLYRSYLIVDQKVYNDGGCNYTIKSEKGNQQFGLSGFVQNKTVYMVVLGDKHPEDPLLRIRCDGGIVSKFFHINASNVVVDDRPLTNTGTGGSSGSNNYPGSSGGVSSGGDSAQLSYLKAYKESLRNQLNTILSERNVATIVGGRVVYTYDKAAAERIYRMLEQVDAQIAALGG